ncbi:MAG TPA: hypothetical protein VFV38_07880 [Ktedonobacteraceae bacterium]|nr:hypothetical protein [Ktedonobacteraceae bacterium]
MSQLPTIPNQSPTPTTPTTAQRAFPKPEMWWMMLAKSKTLRFFAVSCAFLLFLGGLWITFTTTNPAAKTWLNGDLNLIFLTAMGWAVDAAMPEAWLHVVIQHVEQKTSQLAWFTFVAIGVSLFFLGTILSSIMTTSETSDPLHGLPSDAAGWVLLLLVLLRISIGFVYLTVRQCQEWIDRHDGASSTQQVPPPQVDLQAVLTEAIADLAKQQEQHLAVLAQEQRQIQKRLLTTTQEVQQVQQTLLLALQAASKEEPITSALERLHTRDGEQQAAMFPPQIARTLHTERRKQRSSLRHTHPIHTHPSSPLHTCHLCTQGGRRLSNVPGGSIQQRWVRWFIRCSTGIAV